MPFSWPHCWRGVVVLPGVIVCPYFHSLPLWSWVSPGLIPDTRKLRMRAKGTWEISKTIIITSFGGFITSLEPLGTWQRLGSWFQPENPRWVEGVLPKGSYGGVESYLRRDLQKAQRIHAAVFAFALLKISTVSEEPSGICRPGLCNVLCKGPHSKYAKFPQGVWSLLLNCSILLLSSEEAADNMQPHEGGYVPKKL